MSSLALFNLGFMIEEGVEMSTEILDSIHIPYKYRYNNVTLLQHLYSRCKESPKTEAYIPCSIALYRIQALYFWENYRTIIQLTGYSGVLAMTILSTYVFIRSHISGRNLDITNEI
ncbi:Protein sel-1 3 [Mactra antiquata]